MSYWPRDKLNPEEVIAVHSRKSHLLQGHVIS